LKKVIDGLRLKGRLMVIMVPSPSDVGSESPSSTIDPFKPDLNQLA